MKSKAFITGALALIGILLVAGVAFYSRNGSVTSQGEVDTSTTEGTTDTTTPSGDTADVQPMSVYVDGTYTAAGSYVSPGGKQAVTVTVTLKDDVVTHVAVTPGAIDGTSGKFQEKFIGGISQTVVGKNIDTLNVGVVSGSSLTGAGFNDALLKIKTEAKA